MKTTNLPLRVRHFNKQIWDEEGKIYFDPLPGNTQNNPLDYTSNLYQRYIQEGAVLEVQNGWYRLYANNRKTKIEAQGQSFLHLLYYLAYNEQQALKAWAEEQNALEDATFEARQQELEALEAEAEAEETASEQANQTNQNAALKTEASEKPLEWEEIDGVTYLKGTKFVLSKFL